MTESEGSPGTTGRSPLHLAVLARDQEAVAHLLESGCEVDVEDSRRQTPLHLAVQEKFLKGVELLLPKQKHMNTQDEDGNTPTHLVFQGKYWESGGINVDSIEGWSCCISLCELLISQGADVEMQNFKGDSLLHFAILRNMTSIGRLILQKDVDVNVRNERHQTPLLIAVKNNNYSISRMLLIKGARVNVSDSEGNFILHYAVKSANYKMVEMLLEYGADVGVRDAAGQTCLHVAVKTKTCGNLHVLQILVEGKAEVNDQDHNGDTPLHLAVQRHHVRDLYSEKIMKMLLDWGANMEIENNSGASPLDNAQIQWRQIFINHFVKLKAAGILGNIDYELFDNVPNEYEETCLEELDRMKFVRIDQHSLYDFFFGSGNLMISSSFKLEDVKILIGKAFREYCLVLVAKFVRARQRKVLIERALKYLNIPLPKHILERVLHYLSNTNLDNILKQFSKNRHIYPTSTVDAAWIENNVGNGCQPSTLPIQVAVWEHSTKDLKYFISQSPSCLQDVNEAGDNILHIAVSKNLQESVVTLLEAGVDINIKNKDDDTPLHLAITACHEPLVELLVAKGADLNSENKSGRTPLLEALIAGNAYIVQLLLENGCKVNLKNICAYYGKMNFSLEIGYLLVTYGADFNKKDTNGTSLFMHAVRENCPPLVCEWLLDNGADPNCKDSEGETPLHRICELWESPEDLCRLLLSRGANVGAKDNLGGTPLHKAVVHYKIKLLKILVEGGGDLESRDVEGRTVLLYAAENNQHVECVRYLLENGADMSSRDNKGRTPMNLSLMSWTPNTQIVQELVYWGGSKTFKNYCENLSALAHDVNSFKWKCLVECIIKLKCANLLHVFPDLTPISKTYLSFEESCLKELTKMKSATFGQTNCFEVLSNYSDPWYVLKKETEQALTSAELETEFPIYSSLLNVTFLKAKKRFRWLNIAQEHLKIDFPTEIIRHILTFMDDDDLLFFVSKLDCKTVES